MLCVYYPRVHILVKYFLRKMHININLLSYIPKELSIISIDTYSWYISVHNYKYWFLFELPSDQVLYNRSISSIFPSTCISNFHIAILFFILIQKDFYWGNIDYILCQYVHVDQIHMIIYQYYINSSKIYY